MKDLSMVLMPLLVREEKTSTNYILAEYILKNASKLESLSADMLAKACNVSKSSVSRFCRRIGLEDFFSLRHLVKTHDLSKIIEKRYKGLDKNSSMTTNYLNEVNQRIEYFLKCFNQDELDGLTKDIHQYENVVLMGNQQSFATAVALQNTLASFGKIVTAIGEPVQHFEYLKKATNKDLVIVFSASGNFFHNTFEKPRMMERHNLPKIYLITTNHTEPQHFIYKTLCLYPKNDCSSEILLNIYVSLIGLNYWQYL